MERPVPAPSRKSLRPVVLALAVASAILQVAAYSIFFLSLHALAGSMTSLQPSSVEANAAEGPEGTVQFTLSIPISNPGLVPIEAGVTAKLRLPNGTMLGEATGSRTIDPGGLARFELAFPLPNGTFSNETASEPATLTLVLDESAIAGLVRATVTAAGIPMEVRRADPVG